ncbi:MAG: T9SS type A sorting domain-containing protein [Segetibacter sp.]
MKYNKTGGSPKGQCNIIVRSSGRIYQVKANAINTLSIGAKTSGGTPAYFNTKANYTDITNPLSPIAGPGNLNLTVKMNDFSTGGQGDRVSILLQNSNTSELIFSSNWNGSTTMLQTLGGGNVQVRNTKAAKATNPADAPIAEALALKAFPNPSTNYFTVKLQSRVNEKAQLKVFDALGRPVYLTEGSSNQTYRFGDGFASGSYLLQVTQGEKNKRLN